MTSSRTAMLFAIALLTPIALPLIPTAAAATLPSQLPTFGVFQHPTSAGDGAGEPTVGINWATGKVMFQDFATTWRVDFDLDAQPPTAAWANVQPPNSVTNIDPMLFTDAGTGRTYAGGLDGECSIMSYTDDDGANWQPMGNLCAGAFDHQSIVAGPWKEPAPVQALHDRAAYYCAQYSDPVYLVATGPLVQRDACITSFDGGLTWGPPSVMDGPCGGLHGHLNVSRDGTAYLPVRACDGAAGFGWTTDNGLTWTSRNFPEFPVAPSGFDSSIGTSGDDRVWFAFERNDWIPMVGWSDDHGATFPQGFRAVGADAGIRTATFLRVMSGDPDRAALAYLGSTTDGNPFDPSWPGVWHLYVSFTYDGGATWETVQVTQDPVQRGWMCADGLGCGAGRNLLDFMGSAIDPQGRVIVGYADGCIGSCALPSGSPSQSTGDRSTIARQLTGKGLFAIHDQLVTGVDITSPLVAIAGQPYALAATIDAAMPYDATLSWGDGATEQLADLASPVFTATHTYATAGDYDITLSIVGADGATAIDAATVAVAGDGGNAGTITIESPAEGARVEELLTVSGVATLAGNAAPVAAFTFTTSGRDVQFDAGASGDADGDALTFSWTFGDGGNGAGIAPSHTYAGPGTYEVCLVVSDGLATDELCRNVSISAGPGTTTLGTDPEGDAPSPNPTAGNVDDMDILKLEATRTEAGEPVFILTLKTMATPDAHVTHGGDGGQWHVEWTGPQGVDFVDLNAAVTAYSCQWGLFDETAGFNSGQGEAACTVTPGTPGKITITYPAAAMAERGYTGADVLTGVEALTGVYQGTPQDIPVWGGQTTPVDTLAAEDLVLSGGPSAFGDIGLASTARAKSAPDAAPADPHVTDRVSDPIGDTVPTTNVESAWFDSDADNLYVGMKLADIPADPTSTAFIYYATSFKPAWEVTDPTWGGRLDSTQTFTGLRAFAMYSPVRGNTSALPPVSSDTATVFELHLLSTSGTQSNFEPIAVLDGSIDASTDILWWTIPRTLLQSPAGGAVLDGTSAASAPAIGGVVTFGGALSDTTGDGDAYVFPTPDVQPPTVTLLADVASGSAPLAVTFSASVAPAGVASWSLDFGDGSLVEGGSTLPSSFAHTYEGEGLYTATLRVTAPDGGVGTGQASVSVGGAASDASVRLDVPGLAPITATCSDACATWTATLDLAALPDGAQTITATLLQGGEAIAVDSVGVQLVRAATIVIDAPLDGESVDVGAIAVRGRLAGTSDRAPTALLTATEDDGLAPLSVEFTLDGIDDHGISSWTFTTGDGRAESGTALPATIAHVYQDAGVFSATLVVRDTLGREDTATLVIHAQGENRAPTVPASPFPADGAENVSQGAVLTWVSTDADGNDLSFDVYLDTVDASTLVATGQTASYMPGELAASTTYHWRVVASDGIATTEGPVWSFTTKAPPPTEATKPHVVVAVIDTGTNPYHQDFRRANLVEHPSTYLTAFPAGAQQINLCFFDNATKTLDQTRCPATANAATTQDASEWAKVGVTTHNSVGAGQGRLAWFAGTNMLAISFDHVGDAGYATLDGQKGNGDSHGTWTSSNVGGLTTGTCPECIVVLIEVDSVDAIGAGYRWAANQPWIDVITSSISVGVIGLGANPGDFFDASSAATKTAVTNGKVVFEAAGNGAANFGLVPTSTFLYANAAPWSIPVGCSAEHTGQACGYSDWPNPITASGVSRVSAAPDSYTATEGVGGTSFSSPSSAGVAGRALYALRATYGDTQEGPSATGAKTLVRTGAGALPAQGPLANGALTRLELEETIFKTARRSAVPEVPFYLLPSSEIPNTPVNFVKEGFGNVYRGDWGVGRAGALETWSSAGDIVSVVLGQKAMPNRFLEESWWEGVVTPMQETIFTTDVPDTDADAFPRDDEPSPENLAGYSPSARAPALKVGAAATVPDGAAITPENTRVYLHHNNLGPDPASPVNSLIEYYMNSIADPTNGAPTCDDASCPDQTGMGGTGIGTAGTTQTYTLLYPSLGGPAMLDTTKDVTVHVEATGFLAGPTTPLAMTATLSSGGALLGTVVLNGAPGVESTVFEGKFKPLAPGLLDPVELSLAWDGPVYSLHVLSQGASWMDLPVTAALPPVESDRVTYYLDELDAGFASNGDTVALTRDITKLQGDADGGSFFPVPQAGGIVINLAAEDVLVSEPALLGSEGVANVFLCFTPTPAPDAGAAVITANVALTLGGANLGGGSVTKQIVGPDDGRTVAVAVPLSLRPVLLAQDAPLAGSITIAGPGGVATENIGVCGGSAAHPWSVAFDVTPLDVAPTVGLTPLAETVSGVVTVSGTATFPVLPGVAAKTWYATDMADWDTSGQVMTLDTTGPGTGSGGPIFAPLPEGFSIVFRSARPVADDAAVLATDGLGRAQFWVTAAGAAPRVTVDMAVVLEDATGAQRLLGSGSVTKDVAPPLGTFSTLWDERFEIDFAPAIAQPQPDEHLVLLVKVTNAGPASTSQVTSMGGGPDMPIFVQLPTDADATATDTEVQIDFGGLTRDVPVADGAWSTQIDTAGIQNGLRTISVSPRAIYDGVARTGAAVTQQVSVSNTATNTAPTATLTLDSASGPAPHAVIAVLGGSDQQTAASSLKWEMEWGDGSPAQTGTGLPTSLAHTYQDAGLHVARLTVSDAGNLLATSEVAVTVFEPEPIEKVVVLLDGASPLDAADDTGDGSYRDWHATVDVATLGLHTITARHLRGEEILSQASLDVSAVSGIVLTIVGPVDGTRIAPGSTLSGTAEDDTAFSAVEASLDPAFATSVVATSADGFATWSLPIDALGLGEDAWTTVYVRATSAEGSAVASVDLLLDGAPNARIEAPTLPEPTSEPLAFQSASTPSMTGSPIVSWAWDFGDGATSSETHPTHAYARGGTYLVTLAVTDDAGETGTTTRSVLVLNRAPAVSLGFSPASPTTADTVAFTAGATDADGTVQALEIVAYGGETADAPVLATGGSALSLRFPDDGAFLVEARATDDQGAVGVTQTLVTVSNLRPVAALVASLATVGVGQDVELNATGSHDPDGVVTSYRFDLGDGTVVEQEQPVLVHQYETRGVYLATVTVTDDDLSEITSAPVQIVANAGPTLGAIGNKLVDEGTSLAFTLSATDAENDPLTFSATPLPAGATLDPTSGAFSWTPTFQQTGNYEITFSVSDGRLTDAERIVVSVGDVPLPPSLATIGSKTGAENAALTFRLQATDGDTPQLTFGADGLPTGASLDAATGLFAWTPSFTQAGAYTVRFTVTDGQFTDDETVAIAIANTDRAPVLQAVPSKSILQLATAEIPLTATDADGDVITWSLAGPAGATVRDDGNGHAMLVFTPTTTLLGPYTATVTATAGGLAASKSTVLTVLFKAGLTVTPVTPSTTQVSPGEIATLEATLQNTGPNTDTFRISVSNTHGWTIGAFDEYVVLGPGESATLSVDVTADRAKPVSFTTISALSLGDGASIKSARLRVIIPVVLNVTMDTGETPAIDLPRGVLHVKFLDDTVVDGAVVSITQTPETFGSSFRTMLTGTADANGDYAFDLSKDPKAMLPGEHELYVTARLPSGLDSIVRLTYTIGV